MWAGANGYEARLTIDRKDVDVAAQLGHTVDVSLNVMLNHRLRVGAIW
jgi:hypothetical protein